MISRLTQASRTQLRNILESKALGSKVPKDANIAKLVGYSTRTIRTYRSNLEHFGAFEAPRNRVGRPKKITPNMQKALEEKLSSDPCRVQHKMAAFLNKEFENADVSRFCVGRLLKDDGWTKKVTRNVAQERNPDLRDDYLHERSEYRSYHFVLIDESGCDRSVGIQKKGWAPRGVRPVQVKRFHRGRRYQILLAYTQSGVLHFRVFEGSTDSAVFESFIEELLPYCGRWPEPNSVLIMDNAGFHRTEGVRGMCEAAGVIVLMQSPYSPDLNPMEEFFGELKNHMRQIWNEHEDLIRHDFGFFLEECVRTVGEREKSARGHFERCGISIDELPACDSH